MRTSLVEPITEIFEAANVLSRAADAHLAGQRDLAASLLAEADNKVIWAYTDGAWGAGAKKRYGFVTVADAPSHLPLVARPVPRMPTLMDRAAIVKRDHRHCRFCGIPLIDTRMREFFRREYPIQVPWLRTNNGQHAAFQCMWLQYDHLLPNSRGGDSSIENVVLTCAPCNFGRMEATLEEARLLNPLASAPRNVWDGYAKWDGLERVRVIQK